MIDRRELARNLLYAAKQLLNENTDNVKSPIYFFQVRWSEEDNYYEYEYYSIFAHNSPSGFNSLMRVYSPNTTLINRWSIEIKPLLNYTSKTPIKNSQILTPVDFRSIIKNEKSLIDDFEPVFTDLLAKHSHEDEDDEEYDD